VAIAAIQHQEGIEKAFTRQFPLQPYVQTFSHLIDDIRMTCQQFDNVQGFKSPAKSGGPKDADIRRANAALTQDEKAKKFEKYKAEMKTAGLWIEPDVYSTWTPAQKLAHAEKAKKRVAKKHKGRHAPAAPTVPAAPTAAVAPAAPIPPAQQPTIPSYAAMTAGQQPPPTMMVQGRSVARRTYKANNNPSFQGSLVDGGCNGGLAGDDCLILETHSFGKVDIVGVGDNLIKDVPLCTLAGLIKTLDSPIIGIMHNYAALGTGGSIHSPLQMQDFGVLIDDKAKTQKRIDGEFGTQKVRVTSGDQVFDIPLVLNGGLPYFKMTPPTQEQLADATIPHVTLTSGMPWNPSKYNEDPEAQDDIDVVPGTAVEIPIDPDYDVPNNIRDAHFAELERQRVDCTVAAGLFQPDDEFGKFNGVDEPTMDIVFQAVPNIIEMVASACRTTYTAKKTWLENNYGKTIEELRPHFAFASADSIKATVEASTQMYRFQIALSWRQC
jgi:hypothetical protein